MQVTRAILPQFRAQGHGHIGFTASASSWGPLPFMSHYAASKAALSTYVEALHKEVRPLGISCVYFMCGGFPTHLGQPREASQAGFGSDGTSIAAYEPLLGALGGMFASDVAALMPGDLAKISKIVVDIIKGEGTAAGKPWAVSVALGSDSFHYGTSRSQEQLKLLDDWKDVSYATDRDEHNHIASERYLKFASILEHDQ